MEEEIVVSVCILMIACALKQLRKKEENLEIGYAHG